MKHVFRSCLLKLLRFVNAADMLVTKRRGKAVLTPPGMPRILIIRPDHLGDLVMTTPLLQATKSALPAAHIAMLIGPWSKGIVERHPAVDRVIAFPFPGLQRSSKKGRFTHIALFFLALRLRRESYDLAINLRPGFWWGIVLSCLGGIPYRAGYDVGPATSLLTHVLPFQHPEHTVVSNLRLLNLGIQQLGATPLEQPYTPEHYPLQFVPTEEEYAWVAQRLCTLDIQTTDAIIVIHPGTGSAVKLWREEAWAGCVDTLHALFPKVQVVFSGSSDERPMLERIVLGIASTKPLILTDMTVGQLAALLERAQLVLGVDNGPLHLAASRGRSTLQIFGPTDPCIYGPWGPVARHSFVASSQRCQACQTIPCGRYTFRTDEVERHPCTRLVSEQAVTDAIVRFCEVQVQV